MLLEVIIFLIILRLSFVSPYSLISLLISHKYTTITQITDMLVASLLNTSPNLLNELINLLKSMKDISSEWEIKYDVVHKGDGMISAGHFQVESVWGEVDAGRRHDDDNKNDHVEDNVGDHDHEGHDHSHGHSHGHSHEHLHDSSHEHPPSHSHSHSHNGPLRTLPYVLSIISPLPPYVYHYASMSFLHLAHAEAKTHGTSLNEVHFHEVGAIDSIIDVCGFWSMCYLLNVDPGKISCSGIPSSEGTVWTEHGILPVPAPATARLMEGFKVVPGPKTASGELCTPTGVAILRAALWDPTTQTLDKERVGRWRGVGGTVGVGAGTKEFGGHPNILRCFIETGGSNSAFPGNGARPQLSPERHSQSAPAPASTLEEEVLDDDDYWLKYGVERNALATTSQDPTSQVPAPLTMSPPHLETIPVPLPSPPRNHTAHPTHQEYDADEEMVVVSRSMLKKMVEDMVHEKMSLDAKSAPGASSHSQKHPTTTCNRARALSKPNVDAFSPKTSTIDSPFWSLSQLLLLRCNLDDITAEVIGHVSELLMESGALDVWITGITMKKSRSAIEFNVLCNEEDGAIFLEVVYRNTTTLGIRCERVERAALRRTLQEVDTKMGEDPIVNVKVGWLGEDAVTIHPEYEQCKRISKDTGIPIKVVMDAARVGVLK